MSKPKSVTQWIEDLKQGDERAAAQLWQRYFEQMVQAARRKLGFRRLGAADEEDVALSAFDSLCRGAAEGNFVQLTDRQDLWPLLLTITAQKSIDRIRQQERLRRGGGKTVMRESEMLGSEEVNTIDHILRQEPTPEMIAMMEEQFTRLMGQLRDDTFRLIVTRKLEGHTNQEVADCLGISVHAVGRKLRMIRQAWSKELARAANH